MAKYLVDIDALKDCMELLETVRVNGNRCVALHNVQLLIDHFPKDPVDFDISKVMVKGELNETNR